MNAVFLQGFVHKPRLVCRRAIELDDDRSTRNSLDVLFATSRLFTMPECAEGGAVLAIVLNSI